MDFKIENREAGWGTTPLGQTGRRRCLAPEVRLGSEGSGVTLTSVGTVSAYCEKV